jgi:hypothetical protein
MLINGQEDPSALIDLGHNGTIVVVEERYCGCVGRARWMYTCVVLVAEGEVVRKCKVPS